MLAAWDSAVLSNRHALLDLEAELRAVHAGQEALDRQLGMIETHQKVCMQPGAGADVAVVLLLWCVVTQTDGCMARADPTTPHHVCQLLFAAAVPRRSMVH